MSTKRTTKRSTKRTTLPIRDWRKYAEFKYRFPGLMSEVARELGITEAAVRGVVRGRSSSRRIEGMVLCKMAERNRRERSGKVSHNQAFYSNEPDRSMAANCQPAAGKASGK